jgi:photosynthetic reaction center cytochrome c subunit
MRNVLLSGCRLLGCLLGAAVLLAGCERPPVDSVQTGYRGTGIAQIYNPRTLAAQAELNAVPDMAPPARVRANAPTAGAIYENVQVLGDLSIAEFGRTMDAITAWVSPEASCAYCHIEGNFADDSKYTKIVARRMLQMTQHLNGQWRHHVGDSGVTCYTCHRGQPLPTNLWFRPLEGTRGANFIGQRNGQNRPAPEVALSSLPSDPFTRYFSDPQAAEEIRVAGVHALPMPTSTVSIQQTESTYALMMHMTRGLGVNCTYCHNTRSFSSWDDSPPQRVTAWHGIRMVRAINGEYLDPLSGVFPEVPAGRLGPTKDAAKVNCATCHQGAYKPLYGARMAEHYPALLPRSSAAEALADAMPALGSTASISDAAATPEPRP